ncbi:MAG TPA: hypothetical protein VGD76_10930 [Ramlibacter sp.]
MARSSKAGLLGLLIVASSVSAATVGDIRGRPVAGRPLEVTIPFAVDTPRDRACASASVRYGSMPATRSILRVQGRGLNRSLVVTAAANVREGPVTVHVRVGCARTVARKFTLLASLPPVKSPPVARTASRKAVPGYAPRLVPEKASLPAAEPLFPPAEPEARPAGEATPEADASMVAELSRARTETAAALAQLGAVRKELAAVLDVERRTQQTLINSAHQVSQARSEVARMRLVLKGVAAALVLAAAGLAWWEFNRLAFRMRRPGAPPAQEPAILAGNEMPA